MAGWLARGGNWLWALLAVGAMAVCSACGPSAASQAPTADSAPMSAQTACVYGLEASGDSPALAREQSHSRVACARVPKLCRWSIAFSQFRTHTTPGTFENRPPGSCPRSELDPVLRLAADIRLAALRGAGLCQLLLPTQQARTRSEATQNHTSCDRTALGGVSYRQLSQPVSYIILSSSRPGSPHWAGYLGFASPKLKTVAAHEPPPPGVPGPLNSAISRQPDGTWRIFQLYYEF